MNETRHHHRLHRQFDRFERLLPGWLARGLRWVRHPRAWWIRQPLGIVLVLGGLLGFLPVLGFWMLPLGLLLMAIDIPYLQRPVTGAVLWGRRKIRQWRRRT
jgi:hypothetical protein